MMMMMIANPSACQQLYTSQLTMNWFTHQQRPHTTYLNVLQVITIYIYASANTHSLENEEVNRNERILLRKNTLKLTANYIVKYLFYLGIMHARCYFCV